MAPPRRGEVWVVDLSPTRDHEQAGRRPALVASVDRLNAGRPGLVFVGAVHHPGAGHPR